MKEYLLAFPWGDVVARQHLGSVPVVPIEPRTSGVAVEDVVGHLEMYILNQYEVQCQGASSRFTAPASDQSRRGRGLPQKLLMRTYRIRGITL